MIEPLVCGTSCVVNKKLGFFFCFPNIVRYFTEHNKPPVARVDKDKTVFLPQDTLILNGTNSTDDQKISSYKWTQVR